MRRWSWIVVVALLAGAACGDDDGTGPVEGETRTEAQLTFVRFPSALVDRVPKQASFWAKKGEDRALVLEYTPEPGETEGEDFLTFEVSAEALLRSPDGRLYQRGDSVQIRLTVVEDGRFVFRFEPSGLLFNPLVPAELEIEYARTDGDLNGDGVVDQKDRELESRMGIWKQEKLGDLWLRLGTVKFEDRDEIEAKIVGFTGFCVAA